MNTVNLKFEDREVRKEFIQTQESSIYTGKNVDGEYVVVFLQQGEGMIVKTQKAEKPKWFECIEYDAEGFQESVSYEPFSA